MSSCYLIKNFIVFRFFVIKILHRNKLRVIFWLREYFSDITCAQNCLKVGSSNCNQARKVSIEKKANAAVQPCCCPAMCCYPTPSKGWGHGGRPWSPRSRQLPKAWTRGRKETESPKSERRKQSIAGQCNMR